MNEDENNRRSEEDEMLEAMGQSQRQDLQSDPQPESSSEDANWGEQAQGAGHPAFEDAEENERSAQEKAKKKAEIYGQEKEVDVIPPGQIADQEKTQDQLDSQSRAEKRVNVLKRIDEVSNQVRNLVESLSVMAAKEEVDKELLKEGGDSISAGFKHLKHAVVKALCE